jgi:hypothetical protein
MTEAYNDALQQEAKQGIWATLKEEAKGLSASDYAGLVADVAGIFDPTPISDGVGGIISLAKGDWLGAGLSVLGMIPYIGDAGKIAKIAKRAPRAARLIEAAFLKGDNLAKAGEAFLKNNFLMKQIKAAREAAAKRVREALLKARSKLPCKDCAKLPNGGKKQLQMPSGKSGGKWGTPDGKPPASGNGTYTFDTPATLPNGKKVSSVEYRDGFPNFDKYTTDGKHQLWEVTGDVGKDTTALTREMRKTNPGWSPPDKDLYVLHHFEDGAVGFVPRSIHDKGIGGAAHSGGNTIVNNDLF